MSISRTQIYVHILADCIYRQTDRKIRWWTAMNYSPRETEWVSCCHACVMLVIHLNSSSSESQMRIPFLRHLSHWGSVSPYTHPSSTYSPPFQTTKTFQLNLGKSSISLWKIVKNAQGGITEWVVCIVLLQGWNSQVTQQEAGAVAFTTGLTQRLPWKICTHAIRRQVAQCHRYLVISSHLAWQH